MAHKMAHRSGTLDNSPTSRHTRRLEHRQHTHRVAGAILWRVIVASILLALGAEIWAGAEIDRREEAAQAERRASAPVTAELGVHRVPVRLIERGRPGPLVLVDPVDDGR
jgi:hypothetical protein